MSYIVFEVGFRKADQAILLLIII